MTSNVAIAAVVGGAVLVPSVLAPAKPTLTPKSVHGFHRTAVAVLSSPVLGITGTPGEVSAFRRLEDLFAALVPSKGAVAGAPGLPKLSAVEVAQLCQAFTQAVQAGTEDLIVGESYIHGQAGFDTQQTILDDLLAGSEPPSMTNLGKAIAKVGEMNNDALLHLTDTQYNPRPALDAVVELAVEMDVQGLTLPSSAISVVEAIVHGVEELPSTLASAAGSVVSGVGGVIGNAAASVLLSTPVLLVVAGLLVYRAVHK